MKISRCKEKLSFSKTLKNRIQPFYSLKRIYLVILIFVCLLTIVLGSLYAGMVLYQTGTTHVLKQIAHVKFDTVTNFVKSFTVSPQVITIDISHIDYQKLAYKRQVALENKVLFTSSEDYVPAAVSSAGETRRAEIRLKGDWTDHLESRYKWSFRIKIKGGKTFLGMKRFSIHHPKVRDYINEWVFLEALKLAGVIAPRYEFVRVVLNGKDLGIYALEEHFEKILVENNHRREGPIIKFNEDVLWSDRIQLKDLKSMQINFESEFFSNIDVFNKGSVFEKPILYKEFIQGKDLLESFRQGILPAHKVFDIEKMAKYFAVSELMAAFHGAGIWNNLRFYYNPVTSLLEPIGFDGMAGGSLEESWDGFPAMVAEFLPATFHEKLFSDRVFFEEYIKQLVKVSEKSYLDDFFKKIQPELDINLRIIYREFPYFYFSKGVFYNNQALIRRFLNMNKYVNAYLNGIEDKYIELSAGNMRALPVEIVGLQYEDITLLPEPGNVVLTPRMPSKLVDFKTIKFLFPEKFSSKNIKKENLKIKYKLLGTDTVRTEEVFPYPDFSKNFIETSFIRSLANIKDLKFLTVNEKTKEITVKPGKWNINQDIVIPEGYVLICREGTELNLINLSKIITFSPINFIGSEDNPIVVLAKGSDGQGIAVIQPGLESILKYVTFDGLSAPAKGNWFLTGAVTFYEAPVRIENCRFINNKSEDALNVVRSDFLIEESLFGETFSDAFDADFCSGTITRSSFLNCGNDAIDVSGSSVKLKQIFINGTGDKGISSGEDSEVNAEEVEIKNSKLAFASKDLSNLEITGAEISDCEIGFAVYQKKPEFGPAKITASAVKLKKIAVPHLVEKKSELQLNGKTIEPTIKNVVKKLYPAE
ncbi:MAG: CotH kinase family protein [Candidatus Omnitrophota bacterium]